VIAALALSAALAVSPAAPPDRATWYGARCPEGVSFLGRTDTCSPYVSRAKGGRGGEKRFYAAVGWWRWGMTPITAEITNKENGRKVLVVVRDYCRACHKGRAAIDLSPAAFIALGLTLEQGVGKVSVRYLGAR
jgi:hypothetical protein